MNIVKEFRNPLLKRREVQVSVESDVNPGFAKIQEACVQHFKSVVEHIVIKSLKGSFGSREFFAEVFIYDSVEDKNAIEPKAKAKKKEVGK